MKEISVSTKYSKGHSLSIWVLHVLVQFLPTRIVPLYLTIID